MDVAISQIFLLAGVTLASVPQSGDSYASPSSSKAGPNPQPGEPTVKEPGTATTIRGKEAGAGERWSQLPFPAQRHAPLVM